MDGIEQRNWGKAIAQHQHQEWKTTLYRRSNDIWKFTGPSLKRYEWGVMEKDIAWHDYKKKRPNAKAWGCLTQANLLGPSHVHRGEIDEWIRRRSWDTCASQLRRYRADNDIWYHRIRERVGTSWKHRRSRIGYAIEADEGREPLGLISGGGVETRVLRDI